jgi:hypothetical protein
MDKYVIENGEWKTKTAQAEPEYEDAGWFSTNDSALRQLSVEAAEKYMKLVYGDNFEGEGPWVQYLKNTINIFQYVDADYSANINATIEDLMEVREFNIELLNKMKAAKATSVGEMGSFDPGQGKVTKKPAKAGQPVASKGRSQRVPNF